MKEKIVSVEQLKEGMLITADVYNRDGTIIVPENTRVTIAVMNYLARYSILEVIVAEEFEENVYAAAKELEENFAKILLHQKIDVYHLLDIVDAITVSTDNDMNLCDMLYRMSHSSDDLYLHSLNVSMYAQLLAKWMDLPADETELAGIAGLLHDIGLFICHQKGEKNISLHGEYENTCGFDHMVYGSGLLKDWKVDIRLKQAILTHHERMDLSGFPNRLSYKSLNYISRVVALADAYDTLIRKEDGYEAMSPLTVLGYLFEECYIKFDTEMLLCFIEHMMQNFIQYEVLLSNGKRGKIVMLNKKDPARPLIKTENGFIDLSQNKDIFITEMLY